MSWSLSWQARGGTPSTILAAELGELVRRSRGAWENTLRAQGLPPGVPGATGAPWGFPTSVGIWAQEGDQERVREGWVHACPRCCPVVRSWRSGVPTEVPGSWGWECVSSSWTVVPCYQEEPAGSVV